MGVDLKVPTVAIDSADSDSQLGQHEGFDMARIQFVGIDLPHAGVPASVNL